MWDWGICKEGSGEKTNLGYGRFSGFFQVGEMFSTMLWC